MKWGRGEWRANVRIHHQAKCCFVVSWRTAISLTWVKLVIIRLLVTVEAEIVESLDLRNVGPQCSMPAGSPDQRQHQHDKAPDHYNVVIIVWQLSPGLDFSKFTSVYYLLLHLFFFFYFIYSGAQTIINFHFFTYRKI